MSDTCRNTQTNLIYLNARSLKSVTSNVNKIRDFNAPIELSDSDIFGITETWFNSNILDSELFSDQYTVYRKDGEETVQNKRGGGILMASKKDIISRRRADLEPDCEIMVCDLQASNAEKTALVLCYRPPSFDNEFFCTAMNNTLQAVHHEYENVCVFGDFNFPSIDWSGNENTQNLGSCGSVSFKEIMSEFGHSQINDVISNSAGNILDLIFANIPEMISTVSEFPCIFPTDHAVLKFSIFIPKTRHKKKEQFVYNYKAAQWNEMRDKIVNAILCSVIENAVAVNVAWNGLLDLIEQFMSATIPRVKVKPNRSHSWVDSEIRHLNHMKKMTAWRRAKRSAKCSDWNKFKKLRKQLQKRMKHKYQTFVEDLSDKVKTNPKTFWSFFHDNTQSKAIPDTLTDGDSEYTEPATKANLFNNYLFLQKISLQLAATQTM